MTNFNGIPPAYAKGQAPYDNDRNVSFVSLLNPRETPTAECAFVTCPIKQDAPGDDPNNKEEEEEDDQKRQGSSSTRAGGSMDKTIIEVNGQPHTRRLSETAKTVYGLVCLTTPKALEDNKAPFTYVLRSHKIPRCCWLYCGGCLPFKPSSNSI